MKYQLFLFIIVLFVWSCETKKRKHSQGSSGIRSSNSGQNNNPSSISISGNGNVQDLPPMRPTNRLQERNNYKNGKKRRKLSRNGKRKSKNGNERNVNRLKSTAQDAFALEKRKEVLRSTMRHMFGFEHMNAPRVPQATSIDVENLDDRILSNSRESLSRDLLNSLHQKPSGGNQLLPNPPDFMLELYRTYSEDKSLMLINSKSQGNTIRSFFSVAGEAKDRIRDKGKPIIILPYFKGYRSAQHDNRGGSVSSRRHQMRVFAFNVTSIPLTETIVGSELRLNGLRNLAMQNGHDVLANVSNSRWTAMIAVYRISKAEPTGNETRNVYQRLGSMVTIQPNSSYSWVDSNIADLATRARQPGHIFIVKFDNGNERNLNRRKRSIKRSRPNHSNLESLMGDDSNLELPTYFVVMSDRSKRNTGVRPNPTSVSVQLSPILIVYCNDTTAEIVTSSAPEQSDDILRAIASRNVSAKLKRSRRSASQRLRDDALAPPKGNNEFPGESPRSETTARAVQNNDRTELHDNGRTERRVLQSLKDRKSISQKRRNKKRRKGRKCKKRGRKGKKSRRCPKKQKSNKEPSLNRPQQTCSRKSLSVDFGDMGWADWIISPKNFDAYYCSGLCEFDTMKKAKPSNHAIIQAFIKEFNINNDVPAPCCVPEKLMSLSVLFFDQDGNVVLKVFPNMSVESCACR